jgi:hypothetical protein
VTARTGYRFAAAVVAISAVLLIPALVVGSVFTRVAFIVALLGAAALIYHYGTGGAR